jgi:hypothetical protein
MPDFAASGHVLPIKSASGKTTSGFWKVLINARDYEGSIDPVLIVSPPPAGTPSFRLTYTVELRRRRSWDRGLLGGPAVTGRIVIHSVQVLDEYPSAVTAEDPLPKSVFEGSLALPIGAGDSHWWRGRDFSVSVEQAAADLSWALVVISRGGWQGPFAFGGSHLAPGAPVSPVFRQGPGVFAALTVDKNGFMNVVWLDTN